MVFDPDRQLVTSSAELTANEQFFDAMVRHQIGLLRLAGSITKEVIKLLDATEKELRTRVVSGVGSGAGYNTPAQVRRANKLLADIVSIRTPAWRDVSQVWSDEMFALARKEPEIVDGLLRVTMPVDLSTTLPSARRLDAIVRTQPFEGKTLRQWARDISTTDIDRISSQIRIGLVQGETGPAIARRIVGTVRNKGTDGVTEITRRQAAGITRTSTNAIANFSRQEYHKENEELFTGELYVATLDFRTTKICASLDGKVFPVGEGQIPPVHFNCRSLRVAIVDAEAIGNRPARSFTQKQLLREFSAQEGISTPKTRAKLPRGTKGKFDTFARKRMRELTGRVPAKTTYQEFLSRQSDAFQDDYLGKAKGRLFRSGVPLDRFVDPAGNPIPLDQLARADKKAFVDAGLDPEDFL